MNFRNRTVSILSSLALSLALSVDVARAPEASDRITVALVPAQAANAPDLAWVECAAAPGLQRVDLHFEMISAEPDALQMRELLSVQRPVDFEWNPRSGELSYNPRAPFAHPEHLSVAASPPGTASCEPR